MAISKVKSTFSTYTLDDSLESKNYHRVLFKPGVSVQARELTELQTNLQRQIDYHGQHTFADGQRVVGGELVVDTDYDFVKVESTFTDSNGTFNTANFISTIANTAGATLTNGNGVEAKVIQVISEAGVDLQSGSNKTGILDSGNTSDPLTIYIKYSKGSGTANSNKFAVGEVLTSSTNSSHKVMVGGGTDVDNNGTDSNIVNSIGIGSRITMNEGIYFYSGTFVYVSSDNLILEKYTGTPNVIVGLNITESVITTIDDPNLVDNAQGFPNASAPGASRYKVATQLIKEPLASPNSVYTNYLKLLRVQNGVIQKKIAPAARVNTEMTRRLAHRTFEESGNYALNPFVLDIKEHFDNGTNGGYTTSASDDNKYVVGIEPNVAYVQGFRTENVSTKFIEVDKPRETSNTPYDYATKQSTTSSLPVGNYIRVKINTTSDSLGLPNINDFREMALIDQSSTAHTALVDSVNDAPGFTNSVSTGRAVGVYTVTDNGSTYGSENCKSSSAGGGQGSGAKFKITIDQSKHVAIEVIDGGSGYHVNNVFTVKGTALGGATTANDLTFNVAQLGVGRARCRAITVESADILRLYLFDIVMTKGQFAQVDKVEQLSTITGGGASNVFHAKLVSQVGDVEGKKYDTLNNSYLFKLPYYGIKTAEIASDPKPIYQIQKRLYADAGTTSGSHTFASALDADETLVSTSGVIVSLGSGTGTDAATVTDATAASGANNSIIITSSGISSSKSICAIVTVQKTGAQSHKKIKTFTEVTNRALVFDGTNPLPLDAYDIYNIVSVKQGATDGPDITDKFELDNGQRANYYDEGRLIPISPVAAGTLYVTFSHYVHGSGEYIVKDSYPSDGTNANHLLKDVPTFRLPSGEEVDLKRCVDFRPVKATVEHSANNYNLTSGGAFGITSGQVTGSVNSPSVQPSSQFIMNAEIWLARIDKIVLSRSGEYSVLKGVSGENPVPQDDPVDCMVIGTLKVKPYAYDAKKDILPELRNYKRYTMKHIADIDSRVKKLEYFSSLSLMEQETFNISLNQRTVKNTTDGSTTYVDTVERFKNGIFTDQFKGHAKGHVTHPNYKCSIDRKNNVVRPMYDEQCVNLVRKPFDTGVGKAQHHRSSYVLPYTMTTFIDQPNATETEFINPYNMFVWAGNVRLSPDSDEWKDVVSRPDIIINDDGQFDQMAAALNADGVLGYDWGEWSSDWSGVEHDIQNFSQDWAVDGDTQWRDRGGWMQPGNRSGNIIETTTTTGQSRDGLLSFVREDTVTRESGDVVVEVNFVPFIRSREIFFTADMMKPNTKLYAYFNGVNVTNYCAEKPFEEFTDRVAVVDHRNKTVHPGSYPGVLTTDASGRIEGSFIIPNSRQLQFKTGERVFKLTDSSTNNSDSQNTYAETVYRAQGLIETTQNTIVNTKVATIATREVSETRVITERNVSDNTTVDWFDPLAQSVLITEEGGVFVTELDLFLNEADANIPLNVSIREMVNGYPTQKIVPGTDVTLYPSTTASGVTNANTMDQGKRYRIVSGAGTGNGQVNFTTVGSPDNTVGTVFRVPLDVTDSTISNLAAAGKVNEVNVIYTAGYSPSVGGSSTGSMLSADASQATPVTFANPVYLSQDQEYAIVLMSNSDVYKVFVTSPGKIDLTTNAMVDGNHYGGSFFMSQNASTWTADPARDLKFKLKKAVFDSTATITFVNDQLPVKTLKSDPFFVCTDSAAGSAVLRVSHPNHGMMEGSKVVFSGCTSIQSVTATLLNATAGFTISDVELDSYCITVTDGTVSAMTEETYGGGDDVTATENMSIDALVPYVQSLNLPDTSISVTFDSFTGRSQDGSQGIFNKVSDRPLTLNKTNYLSDPICIASSAEHVAATGNLNNTIAANKSFGMTITLSTSNTNLTPIVDGDRCSLFAISNRTNHAISATEIGSTKYNNTGKGRTRVADTAAKGNSNLNNYITKEITLSNEATHLNFYADAYKPEGSDIILYYKAQTSGDDVAFDDLIWTRLEPTVPIPTNDSAFGAVEYEVDLGSIPEVTDTFSSFAFKAVMVTTNSCKVPMLSNVRAIAST